MSKKAFLLLLLLTITANAGYEISWHTIDGGGGLSSGGQYRVHGTIAQPEAGVMAGDDYELLGGLEFDSWRFGMALENHKEIGYRKWTYLSADYIIRNFPLKNFSSYAGLESSVIYREDSGAYYSDTTFANPGMNLELQYAIPKSYVALITIFH